MFLFHIVLFTIVLFCSLGFLIILDKSLDINVAIYYWSCAWSRKPLYNFDFVLASQGDDGIPDVQEKTHMYYISTSENHKRSIKISSIFFIEQRFPRDVEILSRMNIQNADKSIKSLLDKIYDKNHLWYLST